MLRKGDVVTIQGTVRWDVAKDDKRVCLEIEGGIDHMTVPIGEAKIFRQEIRAGDRVKFKSDPARTMWPAAKVIAIDGDDVFARDDEGRPLLWKRQELTRIDDEGSENNGADS